MSGELYTLFTHIQFGLLLVSLILALLQCYFGFRFIKFWITAAGVLIGAAAGAAVVYRFFAERPWYVYLIIAAAAFLVGFLSYKLYVIGVFLFCGIIAAAAVYALLSGFSIDQTILYVSCGLAFLVAGALGVRFQKPLIILITAVSGAMTATRALSEIVPLLQENAGYRYILLGAFSLTGILMQFLMNRGGKRRK